MLCCVQRVILIIATELCIAWGSYIMFLAFSVWYLVFRYGYVKHNVLMMHEKKRKFSLIDVIMIASCIMFVEPRGVMQP